MKSNLQKFPDFYIIFIKEAATFYRQYCLFPIWLGYKTVTFRYKVLRNYWHLLTLKEWNTELTMKEPHGFEHETLGFGIQCCDHFFFLCRSPSSSLCMVFGSISSNIDEVLSISPSTDVFVFGDFNSHQKDWLTYSGGTDRPVWTLL